MCKLKQIHAIETMVELQKDANYEMKEKRIAFTTTRIPYRGCTIDIEMQSTDNDLPDQLTMNEIKVTNQQGVDITPVLFGGNVVFGITGEAMKMCFNQLDHYLAVKGKA